MNNTPDIKQSGSAPLPSAIYAFENGEIYLEDYTSNPMTYTPSYDRKVSIFCIDVGFIGATSGYSSRYSYSFDRPSYYFSPEERYDSSGYNSNSTFISDHSRIGSYSHSYYSDYYQPSSMRQPARMNEYPNPSPRSSSQYIRPKQAPSDRKSKGKNESPVSPHTSNVLRDVDSRNSTPSLSSADSLENIPYLVTTQNGCRRLQNEIDRRGVHVIDQICKEMGDALSTLLMNHYGNYLFQKMIVLATDKQKRAIVTNFIFFKKKIKSVAEILPIAAKNMQGTRCVQTMIDVFKYFKFNSKELSSRRYAPGYHHGPPPLHLLSLF